MVGVYSRAHGELLFAGLGREQQGSAGLRDDWAREAPTTSVADLNSTRETTGTLPQCLVGRATRRCGQ